MIYLADIKRMIELVEELKELNESLNNEQIKNIILDYEEILKDVF